MSRALILGISGQDGSYLARLLLAKGYTVFGTSRNLASNSFSNLRTLGLYEHVHLQQVDLANISQLIATLEYVDPLEVYNFVGQSSVARSFSEPTLTFDSIVGTTTNILEAIRLVNRSIRLYHASSSECFGETGAHPADESTAFRPKSPYGIAKAAAHWQVALYREAFGLFACSGIMFNHESPLRPAHFVTQKIVHSAARIAAGLQSELILGDLTIERDWGWAPDYVEAAYLALRHSGPDDYVIATGRTVSLEHFVQQTFDQFNLDWRAYVRSSANLFRPSEHKTSRADPRKAEKVLGWRAKNDMRDVVKQLAQHATGVILRHR